MRAQSGFTLIELMVVVAVLGIIAAIALPSYNEHVRAGRRAAALSAVGNLALQQERWRAENTTYADYADLEPPEDSDYYEYDGTGGADYNITATPVGDWDSGGCGILTATNNTKPSWDDESCDK